MSTACEAEILNDDWLSKSRQVKPIRTANLLSQNSTGISGFEMLISRQVLQQLLCSFSSPAKWLLGSLENGGF
jgi:hypothetical protein